MSAPIFADPILDGAADPTVIHRRGTNEWWMFYTNRRATFEGPGVQWVHGSPIGVAISTDGGLSWHYKGTVAGLDDPADPGLNTHWAPEVVWAEGEYHMFLSYIAGTPEQWAGHERHIVHFVSDDLTQWRRIGPLRLSSNYVIDAAVDRCPDGLYRLWYKDEGDGSSTRVATSPDLYTWTLAGVAVPASPGHEGPNVFQLGGWYWMLVDEWRGLGVFRSADAIGWARQGLILDRPGAHPLDKQIGRHADVVPNGDEAAIFYFTHPQWSAAHTAEAKTANDRRTTIHWARLLIEDGQLVCRRDEDPAPLETGRDGPSRIGERPPSLHQEPEVAPDDGPKASHKPRVHASTINALVGRILSGEYPEGRALPPEATLCTQLGVSHSALREAIRVLAVKGLVKARPRIGTIVQPRSQWHAFDEQLIAWLSDADVSGAIAADLASVRRSIEPTAAAMAAELATARDLVVLEDALERMQAAAGLDDIQAYVAADRDFHQGLLRASHNWLFEHMSALVVTTADHCLRVNTNRGRRPAEAIKWHAELVDRIRFRDRPGAIAAAAALFEDDQHAHGLPSRQVR